MQNTEGGRKVTEAVVSTGKAVGKFLLGSLKILLLKILCALIYNQLSLSNFPFNRRALHQAKRVISNWRSNLTTNQVKKHDCGNQLSNTLARRTH